MRTKTIFTSRLFSAYRHVRFGGDPSVFYEYRSFRQRVRSTTTSSPTYEVDSPTSNVSSPTERLLICQSLRDPMSKILFRLAWQWMKERGISCMALSSGYTYLAVRLAPQWIKERGIIDMRVRAKVSLYSVV